MPSSAEEQPGTWLGLLQMEAQGATEEWRSEEEGSLRWALRRRSGTRMLTASSPGEMAEPEPAAACPVRPSVRPCAPARR